MGILVLCAALPYLNTLFNGFVYDDSRQVLINPYIRNFHHLREVFTTTVWSYLGGAESAATYYRPMMTFLYLVWFQLFGPRPFGFHLINLTAHVAVTGILFKLTEKLFQDRTLAFIAAVLFALHPIHTESVAWIAAVTDLELTFFYLLALWFFLALAQPFGWRWLLAQLGMVGNFVLALLSKEQALTFPLLATAYEHLYRHDRARTRWAQKVSRYGVLWLLAVAYLLFRIRLFGRFASVQRPDLAGYEAFFSALALVGQYLGKLLWPVRLCAYYVFRKSWNPLEPRVLIGSGALVLCALLFAALWRIGRPASFGLVWLLVTLAPVLNARWMPASVFAERYLYLPSVGFCWLFAWGCRRFSFIIARRGAAWRKSFAASLCILAGLCVARIVTRNRDWHDDLRLYTRTLAAAPDAYYMHNNLGVVYWNRGDLKEAEREWSEAFELAPNAVVVLNNLGMLNTKMKRYEEAVGFLQKALELQPNDPDAHVNLGIAYREMGGAEAAESQLRAAVTLAPLSVRARNGLGESYFDAGRLAEAEEQFQRSLESEPSREGYWDLGFVYWVKGDRERAERAFKAAESLSPTSSRVHSILGLFYAATGRNAEAMREYQEVLRVDPTNPEALAAFQKLRSEVPNAKSSRPRTSTFGVARPSPGGDHPRTERACH